MIKILESLNSRKILEENHIIQIREGIKVKYPDKTKEEQKSIMRTTLSHVINNALEALSEEVKDTLRYVITTKIENQTLHALTLYDLVTEYMALNQSFEQKQCELFQVWMSQQLNHEVTKQDIELIYTYFETQANDLLQNRDEQGIASDTEKSTELMQKTGSNELEYEKDKEVILEENCNQQIIIEENEDEKESDQENRDMASSLSEEIAAKECATTLQEIELNLDKQEKGEKVESISRVSLGVVALMTATAISTSSALPVESNVVMTQEVPTPSMQDFIDAVAYSPQILVYDHIHSHLQYKEIDEQALKVFLLGRHSLLAQEPYFSKIIQVAKEFYLNPLLLFAITGQEQGFVKRNHPQADKIVNNPFNVFGSWQEFNTDILDTSRIAARTIVNLSRDCPEGENQIKWINRLYAEDPNWHKGVTSIFNMLEEIAGTKRSK